VVGTINVKPILKFTVSACGSFSCPSLIVLLGSSKKRRAYMRDLMRRRYYVGK
jgi:hypothetical protein